MKSVLVSWIGFTDLRAPKEAEQVGLGPIAQAVEARKYDKVTLISDYLEGEVSPYLDWLRSRTQTKIAVHYLKLSSPMHFGEIYEAAAEIVADTSKEHSENLHITFHLSPGTPAMAAVWILLAKTRFPAELIQSSKEHGVVTALVPFDISVDFIPHLFRRPDENLERLAAALPLAAPEFGDIIYRSEVMRRVVIKARRIAPRSIPVLIEGESGTGKELLARAIHDASPRKNRSFVVINCGAIPTELVESELFGHERGAFTGAVTARVGHFEAAHQGTIFLDEVGELPKEMQVKLLRTVQEGEVRRVGATQARKVDIRIIAATNRILIDEVAVGAFREDLFYRLAVAVIKLPALRERTGDISLLIDYILGLINKEGSSEPGYSHKKISASARNLLLNHSWPGNIRELQNTLTRAAVWSADEELTEEDIREALLPVPATTSNEDGILNRSLEGRVNLPEIMKTVAVHYLERGLAQNNGNKSKTAITLGLPSYQTLTNWLKKYGLE